VTTAAKDNPGGHAPPFPVPPLLLPADFRIRASPLFREAEIRKNLKISATSNLSLSDVAQISRNPFSFPPSAPRSPLSVSRWRERHGVSPPPSGGSLTSAPLRLRLPKFLANPQGSRVRFTRRSRIALFTGPTDVIKRPYQAAARDLIRERASNCLSA